MLICLLDYRMVFDVLRIGFLLRGDGIVLSRKEFGGCCLGLQQVVSSVSRQDRKKVDVGSMEDFQWKDWFYAH